MMILMMVQMIMLMNAGCRHTMRTDKLGRPAHCATRTFQALRIFVNNELNELHAGLDAAHLLLRPAGLCLAISFHSLEDRIIKRHFHAIDLDAKANMSVTDRLRDPTVTHPVDFMQQLMKTRWQPVTRSIITPSDAEISANPRARSAKLRAASKLLE